MARAPIPASDDATPGWRMRAEGDRCLVLAAGGELSAATSRRCLDAARALRGAALPGVTDIVPGLDSVALHYAPARVAAAAPEDAAPRGPGPATAYDILAAQVRRSLADAPQDGSTAARTVEIPVRYGGEHGPDLDAVAQACRLTPEQVVALHGSPGSRVLMLGFAPGHPYIGVHDARLALPRRGEPRTAVPPGSVAIANRQTVIYPQRLPGGWHIIGATPLRLFDPERQPPALLAPGDDVRFVPIDDETFARLQRGRA